MDFLSPAWMEFKVAFESENLRELKRILEQPAMASNPGMVCHLTFLPPCV